MQHVGAGEQHADLLARCAPRVGRSVTIVDERGDAEPGVGEQGL